MSFNGCVFDLDGVIVDTVHLHFKAWQKMFGEYGKDFTFEDYKEKVDGIPRMAGARAILTDVSEEELDIGTTRKQDYFLEFLDKEGVQVYDTTVALIKELKDLGIKRGVMSSSKNCLEILTRAGLVDLFDNILTGHDIKQGRGKPHPDVFLLSAKNLGVAPEECIVFEDAVLGVQAGKSANMKCVGIDRYGQPERLRIADIVVSDLADVSVNQLKELFI